MFALIMNFVARTPDLQEKLVKWLKSVEAEALMYNKLNNLHNTGSMTVYGNHMCHPPSPLL
jgi:hypothetical protein